MNKPDLTAIKRSVQITLAKKSPEILTGIGIAGMATATVLAVRATPKALILIEDAKRKKRSNEEKTDTLKPLEVVKATWKCYIPTAATMAVSIGCIIGATSVSTKRTAALATAYSLSETALKGYQSKVIETIGEKKEEVIRDKVAKDKLEKNPVKNNEIFVTKAGETRCYDSVSGRYFKSDVETIKKAVNEINRQLRDEMYMSLNEFYYAIGLPGIGVGDELGWNIDNGYLEVDFSAQLDEDSQPCIVLDYLVRPRYHFDDLH